MDAVDFSLARFGDNKHGRQAVPERRRVDWHAEFLESLRHEHFRRIRLAVIRLVETPYVAMRDAEAGDLRLFFGLRHTVPLRIDIDSHTIGDES